MSTRTKRAPITLDGLRDIYVAYVNRGFPGQCPRHVYRRRTIRGGTMILTARYVQKPRKHYVCDWCERGISGPLIYLYGMAEIGQRPYALRYHLRCCRENLTPRSERFRAALAHAKNND